MVLVFEETVYAYAPQVGRSECEKDHFYNDAASEGDLKKPGDVVLDLGDFNKHAGRRSDGFKILYAVLLELPKAAICCFTVCLKSEKA